MVSQTMRAARPFASLRARGFAVVALEEGAGFRHARKGALCAPSPSPMVPPIAQSTFRWELNSYGYHGDDGHKFSASGHGAPYGPRFSTGDTVGAGIDLDKREIFFT